MPTRKTWVKAGASFAFVIAATCCVVLSGQVLRSKYDQKAGIITFRVRIFLLISVIVTAASLLMFIHQFDFANVHLPDNPVASRRAISGRGILPPVPSEARSITGGVATAVSSVASQAKSVASAVATAIPDADTVIPRNVSIGTKQFCVGFNDRVECSDLPVNTSKIFPRALVSTVVDEIKDFQHLNGILAKLNPAYIRDSFIFGLATTAITVIMFVCTLLGPHFGLVPYQRDLSLLITVGLAIPLISCVSFLIPTVIVYILYSKSAGLQSNIEVHRGDVGGYGLGAFFSAVVMAVLTTYTNIIIETCTA